MLTVLLQQLSPELPLLRSLQELDGEGQDLKACMLLPPASVDLEVSQGALAALTSAAVKGDAKDSDEDSQSKLSTAEPQSTPRSGSETHAEVTPFESPTSPGGQGIDLEAKGVIQTTMSSLLHTAEEAASGIVMKMLCRIWRSEEAGMSVVPCMGDDVAVVGGEFEVFWCCMVPQMDGTTLLTPCTDAAVCGVLVDASGKPLEAVLDDVGAPARPPQGSHAPTWIYGAEWPHCVAPNTLMLSNLPDDLLQEDLIEILDKEGFSGFYDFLYLPSNASSGSKLGYAIVNMTRHEYGLALSASMQGRTSWCGTAAPGCQVTWSVAQQGIGELIKHYRDHPACQDSVPEEMRPTFFSGGWPRPFPALESQ